MADDDDKDKSDPSAEIDKLTGRKGSKAGRIALNAGSTIPLIGGLLSAAAGAWSEHEQEQVNRVFQKWFQSLEEEMREKSQTILEIMARIDMLDQEIKDRISSEEYQAILEKSFRSWSSIDSEDKRVLVRNVLSNAAASKMVSDDVVKLFIEWLGTYSMFHFQVIGAIYKNPGISRGGIWRYLGREPVREDSADADLYKLLIRDLSTGGVVRQRRQTDAYGNFVAKKPAQTKGRGGTNTMKSAFDNSEPYELTDLGQQFVHYAMNELAPRIEFHPGSDLNPDNQQDH